MANRYGKDIGRQGRRRTENDDRSRSHYPRSSGYGGTPFGNDERYFGGSRGFGEGYSSGAGRDYDSYDRDLGSYGGGSEFSDPGSSETNRGDRGRYRQGSEYSQRSGRQSDRGGYGREDMGDRYSGGSYGGPSGTGSTRGNYGGERFEQRFGGQGSEDFGRYSSGYQPSERNYMLDREDAGDRGWWDKTSDEVASWFGDESAARRRRMDERTSGHRGRGPSGYKRSDDRIKEDINDRLTDYDYIDATHISVEVQGGDVTLSGTVSSRYEKRLAEDIAEDISGVNNVENRLRISSSTAGFETEDRSTPGSTSAGDSTSGTQAKGKSSSGS